MSSSVSDRETQARWTDLQKQKQIVFNRQIPSRELPRAMRNIAAELLAKQEKVYQTILQQHPEMKPLIDTYRELENKRIELETLKRFYALDPEE